MNATIPAGIFDLLMAIAYGDFMAPIPRCGALIRAARCDGLIAETGDYRAPLALTARGVDYYNRQIASAAQ